MRITIKIPASELSFEVLFMAGISKSAILIGALLLMIVAVAVVRFLVHELVRFIEISAILVLIILALAWLVARRSGQPGASKP
jgi:hypothetical protein